MRAQPGLRARAAARIAARQHGVVAARQLLAVGYSASAIDRLVAKGWLHREFRGVFRLGHRAPSVEARYLAAVLACGDRAVLAGLAAAHHLGLLRRVPLPEVAAPGDQRHRGILIRRPRVIERVWWRRIPLTPLPRIVVDVAPRLDLDDLAQLCHEADVRHGLQAAAVVALAGGRPGVWKVRAVLEGDHPTVLSRLERMFRSTLRAARLPLPVTNRREGAHYVDCRWRARRLTVELDSFRFHRSRHAWEEDRQRERDARARGDEFRRYTWRDVAEDPAPMLADLRRLLA